MHFGLFNLMTQRNKDKQPAEIYRETMEHVRMAEDIGFEIGWFAEHHFSNYCLCPSPMMMSAYAAGLTKRIKLGPAVIVAPLYEPVRLLEDIGFVDQLSNGRLVLGFGTGYQEYEFHKFGIELSQGREIFLETLDFLHTYLGGDPVQFAGDRAKLPETSFSVRTRQERPVTYIAGMVGDVETQRRCVERGYVPFVTTGWNTIDIIQQIRGKLAETYDKAGGDTGAMPFAIQRYVCVTDDKDEALKAADGARYVRRIAMAMRHGYGELEGAYLKEQPAEDEPPLEEIVARLPIGDAETVAERIAADIEALSPTHMSCFMAIPGLSQSTILGSMEAFGAKVMPLLEKRFGDLAKVGTPAPGEQPLAA